MTVTGEAPIVDLEKTDVSQLVSAAFVNHLPSRGGAGRASLLTPNVTTDASSGLASYRGISGLCNSTSATAQNNSQAGAGSCRFRSFVLGLGAGGPQKRGPL